MSRFSEAVVTLYVAVVYLLAALLLIFLGVGVVVMWRDGEYGASMLGLLALWFCVTGLAAERRGYRWGRWSTPGRE